MHGLKLNLRWIKPRVFRLIIDGERDSRHGGDVAFKPALH